MIRLIPPSVLEFLLFAVLIAFAVVIFTAIRRRWKVAPAKVEGPLPDLQTQVRVMATVRRVFRDPDQGTFLVETTIGKRKLTFCAVDYAQVSSRYTSPPGQPEDFGLYALGTLAAGGAEAMRAQIVDFDKTAAANPELVRLVPAGQFPNDNAVIGRVASHREDVLAGEPVVVYRTQVERQSDHTLFIDIAVEPGADPPFPDGSLVHGSARLFGYHAA